MYLNGTYFQGELTLPQYGRTPQSTVPGEVGHQLTQIVGEPTLEWFIERYEEEFLRKMLGNHLYNAFIEGLSVEEPLQIWVDLKDQIYVAKGRVNLSPAANYVYFYAMRSALSQTSMTGEIKQRGTFSDNVEPVYKQVKAWNDMCDRVQHIRDWIWVHRKQIHYAMPCDPDNIGQYDSHIPVFYWGYWHNCHHWHDDFRHINEYGI